MRTALLLGLGLLSIGCGGGDATAPPDMALPPTDPAELAQTLNDLAALGEKRVGTDPDAQAGQYVLAKMQAAGLGDVHEEAFQFPRHDLDSASLALTLDGQPLAPVGFDVFEGSGAGHADGDVVWVASAHPEDLVGKDLTGKVALVQRDPNYHRSTQYLNCANAGATAMLYLSVAPDNLRQVGSVRRDWEAMGPIPAITVGATDGAMIQQAVTSGHLVHAVADVQAHSTPATGDNVIGRLLGDDPHEIVIGAHHDTWFIGSTDNGSGTAALLALAARRARKAKPRYTLVFVSYDGEEVALYGGYDFLRKHRVVGNEPILAVLNFEIPSAKSSKQLGLARSNNRALDAALKDAYLNEIYTLFAGLDLVPALFGGIIPTDIQGIYRYGLPTATTAVDSPYYHTTGDTPDKVDLPFLASSVDAFDVALDDMMQDPPTDFVGIDPKLWLAQLTVHPRQAGQDLVVDAAITDATGAPQANAPAHASLMVDDFFQTFRADATTDAQGHVTFTIPAADVEMGKGNRFVHVTSGPMWPLVEEIAPLP